MTYLIALIVAIILGAFIAVLSFSNMGKNYGDRNVEAEAQLVITQAHSLEAALIAYENIHGAFNLGEDDTIFTELTNKNLLKNDLSSALAERGLQWSIVNNPDNTANVQVRMSGLEACQWANHLKNKKPLDYTVPSCDTNTENLVCCSQ